MFGLSPTELIVILVVIVVLFGGKKIPELGKAVGQGIMNFKKGMREATEVTKELENTGKDINKV